MPHCGLTSLMSSEDSGWEVDPNFENKHYASINRLACHTCYENGWLAQ